MYLKNKLRNTQNNWLLYSSGIILFIVSVSAIFHQFWNNEDFSSSRDALFLNDSLSAFSVGLLLIAPIFEELSFRGLFARKKWLIVVGSIILPYMVFSTGNNFLGWIFLPIIYSLLFWNHLNPSRSKSKALIILTSLLFAFIHYEFSDFVSISTYIGFLYKLFLGALAIWITQNFGIIKSMLFHLCNNGIVLLLILLSVQFPESQKQVYEDKNIVVTWNRVPRFNSLEEGLKMDNESKSIIATNFSAANFYNTNSSLLYGRRSLDVCQKEPFMRYNFTVTMKNKTIEIFENNEINRLFNVFLIKEKLVKLIPKS